MYKMLEIFYKWTFKITFVLYDLCCTRATHALLKYLWVSMLQNIEYNLKQKVGIYI